MNAVRQHQQRTNTSPERYERHPKQGDRAGLPAVASERRRVLNGSRGEGCRRVSMINVLTKATVLVLNRNWQAINVRTPQEAFCMMATHVATGLEIAGEDHIRPVTWEEWITLPVREQDESVRTVRGRIRVPTVIVAVNFARVPKKRPKLCARAIRERDGNRCQYTGQLLKPEDGSLDHVVPRSRGGRDAWENLVWASKRINQLKADRLPREAGLRLRSVPRAPREVPVTVLIRNPHDIPEWRLFLR